MVHGCGQQLRPGQEQMSSQSPALSGAQAMGRRLGRSRAGRCQGAPGRTSVPALARSGRAHGGSRRRSLVILQCRWLSVGRELLVSPCAKERAAQVVAPLRLPHASTPAHSSASRSVPLRALDRSLLQFPPASTRLHLARACSSDPEPSKLLKAPGAPQLLLEPPA